MCLSRNESVEAWPQEMIGSKKHMWQWDDVFRECKIFVERDCHRTSLGRSLQNMSIGRRMSLRIGTLNTGQIKNHSDQKLNSDVALFVWPKTSDTSIKSKSSGDTFETDMFSTFWLKVPTVMHCLFEESVWCLKDILSNADHSWYYRTASEIARMDFVHTQLDIPAPKVVGGPLGSMTKIPLVQSTSS